MNESQQSLETLRDIKRIMERSSRFISLSGLSGISAGICALAGAWLANPYLSHQSPDHNYLAAREIAGTTVSLNDILKSPLFWIAASTFAAAFCTAFLFTWLKSKKDGIPVWGTSAKRLMVNVSIPLLVGAVFILQLLNIGAAGLIAPGCLLFYGLALINASNYTLKEIRYLGYLQIIAGLLNLCFIGSGTLFWAIGFGIFHIIYGAYMWFKYDRVNVNHQTAG